MTTRLPESKLAEIAEREGKARRIGTWILIRESLADIPALLEHVRAVEAELDEAKAALEILKPGITTSEHEPHCDTRSATFKHLPCNCGLTDDGGSE